MPNFYVAVKGSLHAGDCSVFGLISEDAKALAQHFPDSTETDVVNGFYVRSAPVQVINALAELGYSVVCSTGEAEIVWTLQIQRDLQIPRDFQIQGERESE